MGPGRHAELRATRLAIALARMRVLAHADAAKEDRLEVLQLQRLKLLYPLEEEWGVKEYQDWLRALAPSPTLDRSEAGFQLVG